MNKKKTIVVAIVLLLVLLIGGMLAYFTDDDAKTNTFTLGNVNIQLNETGWELDGTKYKRTDEANENIVPGVAIAKAPTVENIGNGTNGNDAYVFVKVEVPQASISVGGATASVQDIYTINNVNSAWTELTTLNSNGTHVYVYGTGTTKAAMSTLEFGDETPAVFESVTLKNVADPTSLPANLDIVVTAYGIQADGVTETSATDIFALFN